MKIKALLFWVLALPCISYSQHLITGQVTNQHTNQPLPGAHIYVVNENKGVVSDQNGYFKILCKASSSEIKCIYPGFATQKKRMATSDTINFKLVPRSIQPLQLDTIIAFDPETYEERISIVRNDVTVEYETVTPRKNYSFLHDMNPNAVYNNRQERIHNTDDFSAIQENGEQQVVDEPISTFSIDVDGASYSTLRNAITNGWNIPENSVRIEELVNYFDYDYSKPKKGRPFSINTEIGDCPWNKERKLLHIGLQGKDVNYKKLPPSHLVFLLDVSGSMKNPNKLPLLKKAFKLLVNELRTEDKVSIVVYAGAAGLVLSPTSGKEKEKILQAIDQLQAGGSTAGGQGIQLAYQLAKEHYLPDGNNRVILATDGDFNVGVSSDAALTDLIEEKRKDNIFLTVLGLGTGNYKDNKLELLANKGNGTYAYIDNELEAKKVFKYNLTGSLFTIAKDVKIQIEFNPYLVRSYRLIGYENRLLNKDDFQDDTKDAGELGVGHSVTALYELTLTNKSEKEEISRKENSLLYQTSVLTSRAKKGNEYGQINFRYKPPKSDQSRLITHSLTTKKRKKKKVSDNFNFAAAVAGFGLIVRDSEYNKSMTLDQVKSIAITAKGKDKYGHRSEFIDLLDRYKTKTKNSRQIGDF